MEIGNRRQGDQSPCHVYGMIKYGHGLKIPTWRTFQLVTSKGVWTNGDSFVIENY